MLFVGSYNDVKVFSVPELTYMGNVDDSVSVNMIENSAGSRDGYVRSMSICGTVLFVGYNNGCVKMFELADSYGKCDKIHLVRKVREAQMMNPDGQPAKGIVGLTVMESNMFIVNGSNTINETTAQTLGKSTALPDA